MIARTPGVLQPTPPMATNAWARVEPLALLASLHRGDKALLPRCVSSLKAQAAPSRILSEKRSGLANALPTD